MSASDPVVPMSIAAAATVPPEAERHHHQYERYPSHRRRTR